MLRFIASPMLVLAAAAPAQTATGYVPPAGTNAQGATGGITQDGRVVGGPAKVRSSPGGKRWNSADSGELPTPAPSASPARTRAPKRH